MTLAIHALSVVSIKIFRISLGLTYKIPVQKMALTPTLRLEDIWRLQIKNTGTLSMAISEMKLKTPAARYKSLASRQWPGSSGFQILLRGEQRKSGMNRKRM